MEQEKIKEKKKVGRPRIEKPIKEIKPVKKEERPILRVIYKNLCFNIIDD
jgi:hypothetical protein